MTPAPTDLPTPTDAIRALSAATSALHDTVARFTPADYAAPSLLPGWTRAHVVAHLGRNADGIRNLMDWARTGIPRPMYASAQARADDIARDAQLPPVELAARLHRSTDQLAAAIDAVPPEGWDRPVELFNRGPAPAVTALVHRRNEVEIHHLDLATGRSPDAWDATFAQQMLNRAVAGAVALADEAGPGFDLRDTATGQQHHIGPATDPVVVRGTTPHLLAWLLGRTSVAEVDTGGAEVEPPRWA